MSYIAVGNVPGNPHTKVQPAGLKCTRAKGASGWTDGKGGCVGKKPATIPALPGTAPPQPEPEPGSTLDAGAETGSPYPDGSGSPAPGQEVDTVTIAPQTASMGTKIVPMLLLAGAAAGIYFLIKRKKR